VPFKAFGDTQGFSEAARDEGELIGGYQQCGVFLNTSTISPIPTSLLEAAACGCPIVSTNNCAIPELIEHGVNGLLSNDPEQMRTYCKQLLNDKDMAAEMGRKAREKVLSDFSLERFVSEWDNIFKTVTT
jgi:glycosyltransferase involved in cell wall biosynthesis